MLVMHANQVDNKQSNKKKEKKKPHKTIKTNHTKGEAPRWL